MVTAPREFVFPIWLLTVYPPVYYFTPFLSLQIIPMRKCEKMICLGELMTWVTKYMVDFSGTWKDVSKGTVFSCQVPKVSALWHVLFHLIHMTQLTVPLLEMGKLRLGWFAHSHTAGTQQRQDYYSLLFYFFFLLFFFIISTVLIPGLPWFLSFYRLSSEVWGFMKCDEGMADTATEPNMNVLSTFPARMNFCLL